MTRNQRLSRAVMWGINSFTCGMFCIFNIFVGRYGLAGFLATIAVLSGALMLFNREEAKHL